MTTPFAGTTKPLGETNMTDHIQLISQIAHHDAAINAFGSRMTAVESTLGHVQDKVSAIDSHMRSGFASIEGLIKEEKAGHGPGMIDIIKAAVAMVALGAAGATTVTFLVTSQVTPGVQRLDDKTAYLSKMRERDEDIRDRQLEGLRAKEQDAVAKKLESLEGTILELRTNKAWNQVTIRKGGS